MSFFSKLFSAKSSNAPIEMTPEQYQSRQSSTGTFRVDNVFPMPGRGHVLTGEVLSGQIRVGAMCGDIEVQGIEHMNKQIGDIVAGDMAGLLVETPAPLGQPLEFKNV